MEEYSWKAGFGFYSTGDPDSYYLINEYSDTEMKLSTAADPLTLFNEGHRKSLIEIYFKTGSWVPLFPLQIQQKIKELAIAKEAFANGDPSLIICQRNTHKIYGTNAYLTFSPTANCQISSIGGYDAIDPYKEGRLKKLRGFLSVTTKPLLLLDVLQTKEYMVEEIFKGDNVVLRSPYTSSNNSKMVLYIVKTAALY